MVETDVKCVKLKSDRQSLYRMNEFYGIHCYQPVSFCGDVTGLSWTCRRRHGEVGIMEFGLNQLAGIRSHHCCL